jgi:hypothetical protein
VVSLRGGVVDDNDEVELVNMIDEIWKYVTGLHNYTLHFGRSFVNIFSEDFLVYGFPFHFMLPGNENTCIP